MSGARWLDDPGAWARAAAVVRASAAAGDPVGWDSETFGHVITETTAPHRARVHVWSLGVLTATRHPRGHRVASGAVFPAEAMLSGPLREALEDPAVVKVAWNAPHDVHAAANHGVTVRGAVDGLTRLKVMRPDLPRHGLKTACALVGRGLTTFESTLTAPTPTWVPGTTCACDVPDHVWWTGPQRFTPRPDDCPRRGRGHPRVRVLVLEERPALRALESVVPGDPLHPGLVDYAAEDAVTAVELWDWMDLQPETPRPAHAWAPGWEAP